jgi:hypothetical protein
MKHLMEWTTRASRRVLLIAALAVGLIAATTGIAFAYWNSSGTGSGSASTGTMTIQVTALAGGDSNTTTLIPGGTGDVILRVSNPNAFSVHVTSIAGNGTPTASNGCTPTGVSLATPTDYTPAQFTLAAGTSLIRLLGAASMTTASASNCQGATFTIPVSVTVQK